MGLCCLSACTDSKAEEYTISGNNVTFYVNGKSAISAEKGDPVSVDYLKEFGYDYAISVKNGETEIAVENNTFEMPEGNVEVSLVSTPIEYDVIAPDNVAFTLGIENGKTTVEDSISFTLNLPVETVVELVTVNGEKINANENTYSFSAKEYLNSSSTAITIAVETSAKTYEVNAPAIVSFKTGVKNGRTERADTVEFCVNEPMDSHIVSVKANGQTLTAHNATYSFAVADMLQTTDNIDIVVETEEHNWATSVVEATCVEAGYTEYHCDCGVRRKTDEKMSKNLIADISNWYDGLQFEQVNGGMKVSQVLERGWDAKRYVVVLNLNEEKYLSIDFDTLTATNVLVQFTKLNAGVEDTTTIYTKQAMSVEGKYVFSLINDMGLTENGTYYLTIFIEGGQNTGAIFREVALLSSSEEKVHNYSVLSSESTQSCYPTDGKNVVTVVCEDCGFTNVDETVGVRFLLGEPEKWHHGGNVSITYSDYKATLSLTNADTWGWASRIVSLKPSDYISFTATGKFKVEIATMGAISGAVIMEEKLYTGERVVVPVSSVIQEYGEYIIYLYVIPEDGVEEAVSEFFILSSATEEIHNFSSSKPCHPTETNTITCEICGYTCSGDLAGSRFLLDDPTIWHHGGNVAIEYGNYKATIALTNSDAWGWASRIVNLKTTDYICFTATGKFKVEIKGINVEEEWGTVILDEKAYEGERIIVPVSDIVKENGAYIIYLYVIPEDGVEETISEFFILSNATEEVHSYGNGETECTICGKQKDE